MDESKKIHLAELLEELVDESYEEFLKKANKELLKEF